MATVVSTASSVQTKRIFTSQQRQQHSLSEFQDYQGCHHHQHHTGSTPASCPTSTSTMASPKRCQLLGCAYIATRQGLCLDHFLEQEKQHRSQQVTLPLPPFRFERSLTSYLSKATTQPRLPRILQETVSMPSPLASSSSTPMISSATPMAQHSHRNRMQIDACYKTTVLIPATLPSDSLSPVEKQSRVNAIFSLRRVIPPKMVDPICYAGYKGDVSSYKAGTGCCRHGNCGNTPRRKGLCIKHGGRHFCKMPDCTKCAHRGGFCIAHGGGRRCAVANCTKSAQSGGVCYSHGGGKRCSMENCRQAARSGGYCIQHGKQVKLEQEQQRQQQPH